MQKRGLGSALTILIIIAITLITAVSVYILQEEVLLSPKDKNLNLQEAQPRPNYIIQFTEETVLERLKADKDKNKAIPQKDKVEKQQKKFVKDFPEIRVGHRYQNVYNGISVYLTEEQIAQIKNKNYVREIYPVREGKLDVIESIPNIRADKAWVLNQNLQTERCVFFSDVNLDGNVNLIDMALVKSKGACAANYNYNNDAACFRSDVNRDGNVNLIDMALVKSMDGKPLDYGECLSGEGVTIGIIDTGVDYTHRDLGGCFGAGCKVIGGYDFVNEDSDPMDDHGHGTHVAATAAGDGVAQDGTILKGVAPEANIVAYKVLNNNGAGTS